MNDEQILGLLKGVHEQDLKESATRFGVDSCLPLSWIRVLALNPSRRADEDLIHLGRCQPCASLLKVLEQELAHPSWETLIRWKLNRLDANQVRAMDYHLKEGECQRCLRLTESLWLKGLVKLVEAGEDVGKRIAAAVGGFRLLPDPEDFPLAQQSGAYSLTNRPTWPGEELSEKALMDFAAANLDRTLHEMRDQLSAQQNAWAKQLFDQPGFLSEFESEVHQIFDKYAHRFFAQLTNRVVGQRAALMRAATDASTRRASERDSLVLRVVHPEQLLTLTLSVNPETGLLVAEVKTPDSAAAGKKIYIEIIGAKEALEPREARLEGTKSGCFARISFGRYPDLAERLGADCAVVATFVD